MEKMGVRIKLNRGQIKVQQNGAAARGGLVIAQWRYAESQTWIRDAMIGREQARQKRVGASPFDGVQP
jgi:hypothetical protein